MTIKLLGISLLSAGLVAIGYARSFQTNRVFYERPGQVEFSGEMIVRPKQENRQLLGKLIALDLAGNVVSYVKGTDEYIVQIPNGQDENSYSRMLMSTGRYQYVEPNWICFPSSEPNDPLLSSQWHLFTISAPRAWDYIVGSQTVIIAVTDSGVDLNHVELQNRVPGYNSQTNLPEAMGGDVGDVHGAGHGTVCSGLATATGNNGIGIAGVAYGCKLMPVRITNSAGGTSTIAEITEGIRWAADNGAHIVSTSYNGAFNDSVETTGQYCSARGVSSVWGVGNGGVDTKTLRSPEFDWDHPNVIVVGGTDQADLRASFSNFGRAVDVFAPSTQILSTAKGGGYTNQATTQGTSFSTPMVAGCLALARSRGRTQFDAEFDLMHGSRDMGVSIRPGEPGFDQANYRPGNDLVYGWGRVNAATTVEPRPIRYRFSLIPLLAGTNNNAARGINDRGDVVGDANVDQAGFRPWVFRDGVLIEIPKLDNVDTFAQVINNNRQVALLNTNFSISRWTEGGGHSVLDTLGSGYNFNRLGDMNDFGVISGYAWSGSGTAGHAARWFGTAIDTVDNLGAGFSQGLGINNAGETCGIAGLQVSQHGFVVDSADNLLRDLGGINARIIADNGMVMGQGSARIWFCSPNGVNNSYPGFGAGPFPIAVNEWEEAVGTEGNQYGAFLVDMKHGALSPESLAEAWPLGWGSIFGLDGINNRGDIVGTVQVSGKLRAFIAKRVNTIQVSAELGDYGPIYLGALPPALTVQFTDAAGAFLPNARVTYSYDPQTGILTDGTNGSTGITLPQSVNQPFRIYARLTNIFDDPEWSSASWTGPGYLGKMFPPLDRDALPPDTQEAVILALTTGDCDSDNEVGIGDYALLSGAYSSAFDSNTNQPIPGPGGQQWDRRADIDLDFEISIGDYAILSSNYGLVGD